MPSFTDDPTGKLRSTTIRVFPAIDDLHRGNERSLVSGLVLNGPHNEPEFCSLTRKTWTTLGAAVCRAMVSVRRRGCAREL